jgi:hypothetical protein
MELGFELLPKESLTIFGQKWRGVHPFFTTFQHHREGELLHRDANTVLQCLLYSLMFNKLALIQETCKEDKQVPSHESVEGL